MPTRVLTQQFRRNQARTRRFVALATVLITVLGTVSVWHLTRLRGAAEAVVASQEAVRASTHLLEALFEAESGHRGYILTGQPGYREDYEHSRALALERLDAYLLKVGDLSDSKVVETFRLLVAAKLKEMDEVARLVASGDRARAQAEVAQNQGKFLMDAIEGALAPLRGREDAMFRARQSELEDRAIWGIITIVGLTGFTLLLAYGLFRFQAAAQERLIAAVEIIQRQEGYLASMLSSIDAPVLLIDTLERTQFANPAALGLMGRELNQILGRPLTEVLRIHDTNSGDTGRFVQCLRERRVVREPRTLVETDIARRLMQVTVYPVASPEGKALGNMVQLQGLDEEERRAADLHARDLVQSLEAALGRIIANEESADILRQGASAVARIVAARSVRIWLEDAELTGSTEAARSEAPPSRLHLFFQVEASVSSATSPRESETPRPLSSSAPGPASDVVTEAFRRGVNLSSEPGDGGDLIFALPLLEGEEHLGVLEARFPAAIHELIRHELPRFALQLGLAFERRKSAEHVARLAEEKDIFIATLSHELRGPLAPIRYALDELMLSEPTQGRRGELHSILDRQSKHLLRLVDDLLDVQRLNRGTLQLRPLATPLETVLLQSAEAILPFLNKKGQRLLVEDNTQGVALWIDPGRIVQVLYNLLHNASRYSPVGKRIWVTAWTDGKEAAIAVRDEGIGISEANRGRVFDMFERGTRLESGEGLGIGLALVRELVQLHGGRVAAQSAGDGFGTTFELRLPLVAAMNEVPTDGALARSSGQDAGVEIADPARTPHHVLPECLVIDDDVDAAEGLALLLSKNGYRPRVAHDAEQAVEAAAEARPSLVFLDLSLPGLGRFELVNQLRPLLGQHARLIAVTGLSDASTRLEASHHGFSAYLTKPISPTELLRVAEEERGRVVPVPSNESKSKG